MGVGPRGADPRPFIDALRATAEWVPDPLSHTGHPAIEESEILLAWLESDGVRIVDIDGSWSCPVEGAEGVTERYRQRHDTWQRSSLGA